MQRKLMWSLCALAGLAAGVCAAPGFTIAGTIAAASRPSDAEFVDFDGDGDLDMAVTVDTPDRVLIFTNTGGVFSQTQTVIVGPGTAPGDLVSGDWDGDGDSDLAVALQNNFQVQLLTNIGGVYTLGAAVTVGDNPRHILAADLNGDGDLDLATANRDSNDVSVLTNVGGVFTAVSIGSGDEPRGLSVGHLTGNGMPELVVSWRGTRSIQVFDNSGVGTFTPGAIYAVGANVRPSGSVIADFTGDGLNDVAVATSGNTLNFVALFTNIGGPLSGPVNFAPGGLNPDSVWATDFDADGDFDVLVTNQDSANLGALENIGGAFAAPVVFAVGTTPGSFDVGDMNGDTMPDVAAPGTDSDNVTVLGNTNLAPQPCPADLSGSSDPNSPDYGIPDGVADAGDFFYYLDQFAAGNFAVADLTGSSDPNDPTYGAPDGVMDASDFFFYLDLFVVGCK